LTFQTHIGKKKHGQNSGSHDPLDTAKISMSSNAMDAWQKKTVLKSLYSYN